MAIEAREISKKESCTWCKDTGFVRTEFLSPRQAAKLEWLFFLFAVVIGASLLKFFGSSMGWMGMLFAVLLIFGIPLVQMSIGLISALSWLGFLTRRRPCPRCSANKQGVS